MSKIHHRFLRAAAAFAGLTLCVAEPGAQAPAPLPQPPLELLAPDAGGSGEIVGFHPRIRGDWIGAGGVVADGGIRRGTLHLYHRHHGRWRHVQRLLAPTPAADGDAFGTHIAFGDGVLAVGDYAAARDGQVVGAVHLYALTEGRWVHAQTVHASQPRERGGFGAFVAVDADAMVVGEAEGLVTGGWGDNRALHVFRRVDGRWEPRATIPRPDDLVVSEAARATALAETGMPRHAGFGAHFHLDGDRLLVSAMGAGAFLAYGRSEEAWTLAQRVDEPEVDIGFARTLDLEGDTLLVAALRGNGRTKDTGVAYVYRDVDGRWQLAQKLQLPNGQPLDMFGHWVAIDDGTLVVGAHARLMHAGLAYAFRALDGQWRLHAVLNPPLPAQRRLSAYALDIDDGTVVLSPGHEVLVGSPLQPQGAGGVFVGSVDPPAVAQRGG